MAHRGEVEAIVTTVIIHRKTNQERIHEAFWRLRLRSPLPTEEEKELKETVRHGKKVKLEQKIDPSILGGLVVEFGQKVFDMTVKSRARQMERVLREPINIGL